MLETELFRIDQAERLCFFIDLSFMLEVNQAYLGFYEVCFLFSQLFKEVVYVTLIDERERC